MENVKVENWNGYTIRFVWYENDWWAVAKDVAEALGYERPNDAVRVHVEKEDKNTTAIHSSNKGNPNMTIISEFGIYDLVFNSHMPEAKSFKRWVYAVIKSLRQSSGLEGFEVFRMLDKEHQKQDMAKLQTALHQPQKVDYIKANTIADKAVSTLYGFEKMVKKSDMSPQMLPDRQSILDDTVNLMALNDKYHMHISVSQTIYQQKGSQAV